MAMDVRIMTSRPSSQSASQSRSCWAKGTVLTNKVIYHLVAQAEDEIMFFCYRYPQRGSKALRDAHKSFVNIRHEPFHQSLLDIKGFKQSRKTRCEDRVHFVNVM